MFLSCLNYLPSTSLQYEIRYTKLTSRKRIRAATWNRSLQLTEKEHVLWPIIRRKAPFQTWRRPKVVKLPVKVQRIVNILPESITVISTDFPHFFRRYNDSLLMIRTRSCISRHAGQTWKYDHRPRCIMTKRYDMLYVFIMIDLCLHIGSLTAQRLDYNEKSLLFQFMFVRRYVLVAMNFKILPKFSRDTKRPDDVWPLPCHAGGIRHTEWIPF